MLLLIEPLRSKYIANKIVQEGLHLFKLLKRFWKYLVNLSRDFYGYIGIVRSWIEFARISNHTRNMPVGLNAYQEFKKSSWNLLSVARKWNARLSRYLWVSRFEHNITRYWITDIVYKTTRTLWQVDIRGNISPERKSSSIETPQIYASEEFSIPQHLTISYNSIYACIINGIQNIISMHQMW